MKFPLKIIVIFLMLCACQTKTPVDLIVVNANIYTVNDSFDIAHAFAIDKGKFIDVGSTEHILDLYNSPEIIDANQKTIVPGLIDGHCHFYGLGLSMQIVDLAETKSFDEVIERVVTFQKKHRSKFIRGRGWDQNDWSSKEFPTNEKLNRLFPKTPVALERIDGHALLVNQAALDLAKIPRDTVIKGGEIITKNDKPTGVLIDNACILIEKIYPKISQTHQENALKLANDYCLSMGLTTVDDAGLDRDVIDLIDTLQSRQQIQIRVYAMISANKKNIEYYLDKGIYKTDKLNVRSFKVYGDGALGSRGAMLKKEYSDREDHLGALVTQPDILLIMAKTLAKSDFQMNTHAIGDSANALILNTYTKALKSKTNKRWRIEHAQILDSIDFAYFTEIIPSVQPTHATSDMYWLEDRIGRERMRGAYAYKKLLDVNTRIVLGTDFPVEKVNPMYTFYAAIARKDLNGYPESGFQMNNALTRPEALKGMTIWPAYANFEENEKGSIEAGKLADFVILDSNIMEIEAKEIPKTKVINTYIGGEKVY